MTKSNPITHMTPTALRLARDAWRREMLDDVCALLEEKRDTRKVATMLREAFASWPETGQMSPSLAVPSRRQLAKCRPKDKRKSP